MDAGLIMAQVGVGIPAASLLQWTGQSVLVEATGDGSDGYEVSGPVFLPANERREHQT